MDNPTPLRPQPKNPLHGITLEMMLAELVDELGWEEVAARVRLKCFTIDPSIKSSLTFLRKTPWARKKVEALFLQCLAETEAANRYHRASTKWLAACTYGLGVRWSAPTPEAAESFRLDAFLEGVARSGADYLLFPVTQARQALPCPCSALDAILPGRTTRRDLLGELGRGLADLGKPLIVSYHYSCNQADPPWEQAAGYHDPDKTRLANNLCAIVQELGERYGSMIRAWWFDGADALDPAGPHNAVSTDMAGFQFPWDRFTAAAKAGYGERLVAYHAGLAETYLYTHHQDYWAGELPDLSAPPTGRFLPDGGLQWHGRVDLGDPPRFSDEDLLNYARLCRQHQAPITFNANLSPDGTFAEAPIDQLARLNAAPGDAATAGA